MRAAERRGRSPECPRFSAASLTPVSIDHDASRRSVGRVWARGVFVHAEPLHAALLCDAGADDFEGVAAMRTMMRRATDSE